MGVVGGLRVAVLCAAALSLVPLRARAGEPTDPLPPPPGLERIRQELRDAFRSPIVVESDPERLAAQRNREREMLATLRPVEARLRLRMPDGGARAGLRVRALHVGFDLVTATAETDATGSATLALPPGTWTVYVSGLASDDTVAFGRTTLDVPVPVARGPATGYVVPLATVARLRFRGPGNGAVRPERVDLATRDLEHRFTWRGDASSLHVLAPTRDPFVVQMSRPPGDGPGFLVRSEVAATEDDVVLSARGDGTTLEFPGTPRVLLEPTLDALDPLSAPMTFRAARPTRVVVRGLDALAIGYRVHRDAITHSFYTAPVRLRGGALLFDGEATEDVSVGSYHATTARFNQHRHRVSIRVFFRDRNGLILVGHGKKAPIPVAWRALLHGKEWAKGEMTGAWSARLPALADAKDYQALEFELAFEAEGGRRVLRVGHEPTREIARYGRVRVQAMPQLTLHAEAWARWVNELADAFAEVQWHRPSTLTYRLWVHSMPGLSGWGGWNGNRAYGHFSDSRLFGFARPRQKNDGTLSHEMTHGHRISSHGTTFQNVQSRAVRRRQATRADSFRVPDGQKHLFWLRHLPEQLVERAGVPAGARAKDDPKVGEDEVVAWYVRQRFGVETSRKWRHNHEFLRWWLTLEGFTDDEARVGVLHHFTGENLAWLVRARGGAVTDARGDEVALAASNPRKVKRPVQKVRSAAVKRWTDPDLAKETDLDAALARMDAELGQWSTRSKVYLRAAALSVERRDPDTARTYVLRAMECGARLGWEWHERALIEGAVILAGAQEPE